MRISFVTDIVTPYMASVFEALSRACELTVIFCSDTGTRAMPWEFEDRFAFRHRVVGGLTIRRRHPNATDFYLDPRIFTSIAAARPHAVVTAGYSLPSVYAAAYCALRGLPLVIHSDGTSASESSLNRAQRLARRALLPRAAACVANSGPAADRFRELGVADSRVFMAPHSTRLDAMWAAGRGRRYRLDGPLHVAAVGRLIERKGLDRLVRAAALARDGGSDITLEIVGSGPGEAALRSLVANLDMNDAVTMRGFVSQSELPAVYAAADAFAFPTLRDPFGFVLLEAMAAGLPVVASPRAGATADLVVADETGLVVDPEAVDSLAKAFSRLANDEALRSRLGRAAHAATLCRTPEAAADGYVRAVVASLERRGRP